MEITSEDVEWICNEARASYKRHLSSGIRGQMLDLPDMSDYHIVVATCKRFWKSDLVKENEKLRTELANQKVKTYRLALEMVKVHPAIKAVFDRESWKEAENIVKDVRGK